MSNLTSSSAWKAISAVSGPVDLRKYTKIKPEVASQLACNEDLDLSGLQSLSPELAAAFKNHRGGLILNGLTELTPETAKVLKESFKGSLEFGSVEKLEDEAAFELSQREAGDGSWKYWPKSLFPKIPKLEDTPGHLALFAKLVSNVSPYEFKFEEITPEQAKIVTEQAEAIRYNSIKVMGKEVAEVFSQTDKEIDLLGIKRLGVEEAEALAGHTGPLELSGLDDVSDKLAMALSRHKGLVSIGGLRDMGDTEGFLALAKKLAEENKANFLGHMETVGPKVAAIFATCDRVTMPNLRQLPDTNEHRMLLAKICSVEEGERVRLSGLKEIPDSILSILAECPHCVDLGGPTTWSDGPGHVAWAKKLTQSKPSAGSYAVYAQGEFFPDKVAEVFADPNSAVEPHLIRRFDGSAGNVALAQKLAGANKHLNLLEISAKAAKVYLGSGNRNWNFGSLEKIDAETFQLLFASQDSIYIDIEEISPEVAKLTEGDKSLGFSKVKEINLEVAKCFGGGKGGLTLGGLRQATDDVLAELAKREGGELCLGEITALTDGQAEILSSAKSSLSLPKLSQISEKGLSSLLELDQSKSISLPALTEISDTNAQKLAQRSGSVDISAISTLEDTPGYLALAKKIVQAWRVELTNINKLGPNAAAELAIKTTLKIKGLKSLSPEVAEALAKVSDNLDLPDFSEASPEVARKLAAFSGDLTLGNVDEISDEDFATLVANKKRLSFFATTLSVTKAAAVAKIPNIYISGLETVEAEAAKCFKGYKGDIYLYDLCTLTPEAAKELRKLKRRLGTRRPGEYALATGE